MYSPLFFRTALSILRYQVLSMAFYCQMTVVVNISISRRDMKIITHLIVTNNLYHINKMNTNSIKSPLKKLCLEERILCGVKVLKGDSM